MDGLLVPSKLYAMLAAAKPILFVGSETCEIGRTVLEEDCGFVVGEGDVAGLVGAIDRLRGDETIRTAMADRARSAFLANFQRATAVDSYERVLREVVDRGATP
jgi:glycosyltransferase involved in cell wall biosynthesis